MIIHTAGGERGNSRLAAGSARRRTRFGGILFLLLLIALTASCSKDGNGEPGGTAPAVEARVILPALSADPGSLLVALRRTGFGFLEVNGFDTYVCRFISLPGGWLSGAILYERKIGGEREVASFRFSHAGDEVLVSETSERTRGSAELVATVRTAKTRVVISGTRDVTISRRDTGTLEYSEGSGSTAAAYLARDERGAMGSVLSTAGGILARGVYDAPKSGPAVYRERKTGEESESEEMTVTIWKGKENELRIRSESVVPLNEMYISGLQGFISYGRGLENLALLDIVFEGDTSIRPVLAYALSLWGGS